MARSHITAADLIGGQREDHRGRQAEVHHAGFDDRAWGGAVARDVKVAIVRSVAPPVRRIEEIRPVAVRPVRDGRAFVVDFGQNFSGWVRLARPGPAGGRVTLSYGEWLDRDGDLTTAHLDVNLPVVPEPLPLGQVDEVVPGSGGTVFEPRFTTHGFRYVRVEGHPGPLGTGDVTGVVVHSDLRRIGWFSCSDERVNRLHEAVVWSLRSNVCDIPTDCPQRERAGWTGDWQVFAPTAAYLYDVLAFTRKWLGDVVLDQRADGCVANMSPCPPAEGFDGPLGGLHGSAGWGDVVVSAPWDLYQAYGDTSLLRETWGAMTAWVRFAAAAAASGRHPGPGRGAAGPRRARAVPVGHRLPLGRVDGAGHGDHRLPRVRAGGQVRGGHGLPAPLGGDRGPGGRGAGAARGPGAPLPRHRGGSAGGLAPGVHPGRRDARRVQTQASHVRALAFGLVPAELRPAVAGRLAELVGLAGGHLATGFLSTAYLLPVLAEAGYLGLAYELLRQDTAPSWLTMVDRGATTMWEDWDGVDASGVPHGSLNHYSKGAVATFLHRYVAGLRPVEPGYRTFEVRPRPGGGITWASTRHVGPFGQIDVTWRVGRRIDGAGPEGAGR